MATELKPVYLITGGDRPKIQRALRRLRDRIGEEGVELLSASEAGGEDAVAACNSMGLLGGGRRLVVVDEVERWKAADVKAVAAYLASPAPDTVLALVAAELKKDSPLAKTCAKAGDVLVFDVPKRRVPEWVTKQFAERSVPVDAEAVRLLVEIVGEDPEELASEVDKLATWSGGDAVGVPLQNPEAPARLHLPDDRGPVAAARRQEGTVGREREACDRVGVPRDHPDQASLRQRDQGDPAPSPLMFNPQDRRRVASR